MSNPDFGAREYLCFQVLEQMEDRFGRNMPKTEFYKLCYIVNEELLEEGIDVKLPVHWYRYGGVLTEDAMSFEFAEQIEQSWEDRSGTEMSSRKDLSEEDFATDGGVKAAIDSTTADVVRRFGGTYGVRDSQKYQYEQYAPNDFIRGLDAYRSYLEDMDKTDSAAAAEYVSGVDIDIREVLPGELSKGDEASDEDDGREDLVREYLNRLVETYPRNDYPDMYPLFIQFESISRQLARNGNFGQLYNFTEEFWKAFCRVETRFKHERNTPLSVKTRWRKRKQEEIEEFRERIEDFRRVVKRHRKSTDKLDQFADSYSESVRETYEDLRQ